MYKQILIKIYLNFLSSYQFLKYYKFPNYFSKVNVRLNQTPKFQQKTFLTGLGKIEIGNNCTFGYKLGGFNHGGSIEVQPRTENAFIFIGNNVNTNNNVFISSCNSIIVGNDTLIGQNVCIMDYEAHGVQPNRRRSVGEIGLVSIGENVWIGNNVIILKNTIIGDNSVIAAGAVVMGTFPKNVIIGGVPAKILKEL